jgi:hypothetical protein
VLSLNVSLPPKENGAALAVVLHGVTHVQKQVTSGRGQAKEVHNS